MAMVRPMRPGGEEKQKKRRENSVEIIQNINWFDGHRHDYDGLYKREATHRLICI